MALKVGKASASELATVETTQRNPLGFIVPGNAGEEFIYLKGVASTVVGSWVTYDELAVTALLAANAIGPVAVSMGINVASTYGWYCILAPMGVDALMAADSAADTLVGRETANGSAGDGRVAGDQIYGVIQREATVAAGLATVQIWAHPFVDDLYGS